MARGKGKVNQPAKIIEKRERYRNRNRSREIRSSDEEVMWDVEDVMHFLKVSADWVYRHFHNGDLPGRQMPGRGKLRFDPHQIRAFAKGEPPKEA